MFCLLCSACPLVLWRLCDSGATYPEPPGSGLIAFMLRSDLSVLTLPARPLVSPRDGCSRGRGIPSIFHSTKNLCSNAGGLNLTYHGPEWLCMGLDKQSHSHVVPSDSSAGSHDPLPYWAKKNEKEGIDSRRVFCGRSILIRGLTLCVCGAYGVSQPWLVAVHRR